MEIKNYSLYKTGKKTAKENNLYSINDTKEFEHLMDTEVFDNLDLPSEEKEVIRNHMLEHHLFYDDFDIWYPHLDAYTWYEVRAAFNHRSVYSKKTGKRLYTISEIVRVRVTRMHRDSIYDQRANTVDVFENRNYHTAPVNDPEI